MKKHLPLGLLIGSFSACATIPPPVLPACSIELFEAERAQISSLTISKVKYELCTKHLHCSVRHLDTAIDYRIQAKDAVEQERFVDSLKHLQESNEYMDKAFTHISALSSEQYCNDIVVSYNVQDDYTVEPLRNFTRYENATINSITLLVYEQALLNQYFTSIVEKKIAAE